MATLKDQLNVLFQDVLSTDPEKAINGTQLLEQIRPLLKGQYQENSIRQHFSVMSQDQTSRIAKVPDGHGYYQRETPQAGPMYLSPSPPLHSPPASDVGVRDAQLEEKFRAVFMRYSDFAYQKFPMHVEHTRASRRESGVNQWKFPDVVLLGWAVGELTDRGFKLDPNLLAVKTSLGEPPFSLESVELKVEVSLSTFRESFFQCVSNSKWAHGAVLAIATNITDTTLIDELRRLGASYDVSVVSYGLTADYLESLPSAAVIRDMSAAEYEHIASRIAPTRISIGRDRPSLDWEHLGDLRKLSPDFRLLFEWIGHCLAKKQAYSFSDFEKLNQIERKQLQ